MTIATPKPVADAISKLDAADRGEFFGFSDPSPRPVHGSKPENLKVSWWLPLPSATRPASQTSSFALPATSHISFPQSLVLISILLHADAVEAFLEELIGTIADLKGEGKSAHSQSVCAEPK